MQFYIDAIKNYANFQGRTSRKAFWMHFLFLIILSITSFFIDYKILEVENDFGFISGLFLLFNIIPTIAISVRRLHDIGKSGWYYLIAIIPYIGWAISIYWYSKPSVRLTNIYGEVPKK